MRDVFMTAEYVSIMENKMEKRSFLKFCAAIFKANGFERKGNTYYYDGQNGVLLVFGLQKSTYGPYYYMEHGFAFKDINKYMPYPRYCELDINLGRVMAPFGKSLCYEQMGETECTALASSIQLKIDAIRPVVDCGKERIIEQFVYPEPDQISYLSKGTPEYMGICKEFFESNRIPVIEI